MFDFLKKSLKNKLLVILMGIGFLPFLTLLSYTILFSETKILNKIVDEQLESTNVATKLIDNHIDLLVKEVQFLSSLDLMDDLLSDDIDKRVSRLLIKKADDLNLATTFMVLDKNATIIASSKKELISHRHPLNQIKNQNSGTYIEETNLYIYATIYASFDSKMQLGRLVLQYNLQNLNRYLTHTTNIHSYIINPQTGISIGKDVELNLKLSGYVDNVISDQHVIVYKKLSSVLHELYIVYAVDKETALEFLYDFIRVMLFLSLFIFLIVLYTSIKYSKEILKPIEKLIAKTDDITKTHNYSSSLSIHTEDEIATLTHSFNIMIETTSTALVKLEDEIALMKKTKAASNAKSTFISNMSHELRTPLNSIMGSAQYLMVYEELNEKQMESIGNIESSAEYLLGMINEILDIAKIEAGKMEVHKQNVDILKELENCFEMLSPLAYDKELSFELTSHNFHIESHSTDPKIFKQIVINLISNAIKFTKDGSIHIDINNNKKYIYITVTDSGIGIAKNDLNELFGDFVQLDNEIQQKYNGTGLGLSISKKMASLINGDISIESGGTGYGTKAIFTLDV